MVEFSYIILAFVITFSGFTVLVGLQGQHLACKN